MKHLMSHQRCAVVGIVFKDNRTKVLLIKRRDIPVWALPGGGVDSNESPEEAVLREIEEETGLKTRILRHVALYTPINKLAQTTFVFECEFISGELTLSNETRGVDFFAFDELPETFFFIHREWVEVAQKNLPKPLYEPLSQITYWNLFKYFLRHPSHVFRSVLARCGIPYNS